MLNPLFTSEVVDMFHFVLTSAYFLYNGHSFEQLDGVAMGSLLSPVVADLFTESFDHVLLD